MLQNIFPRPIRIFAVATAAALFMTILGTGMVCAENQALGAKTLAKVTDRTRAKTLPREWQWKRSAIRFDGMYRSL